MTKQSDLGISHSICLWIKDFLSDRPQTVKVVCHYSSCLSLSTGSPLLYTPYTHDCTPTHSSNTIIKFADDTTVVRLISGGDESSYRDEVEQLLVWCVENNLALNITKTKELIIDCRRKKTDIQPLFINGDSVERTSNFRFLGVHLDDDLTWSTNTTAAIKGTSETVLSESTYTETVGVLSLLHREHPHILHLCVVFQLHSRREEGAPEHGPEDYRMSPPLPGRPVQFPLSQEGQLYSQRPISPRTHSL